VCSLEIDGGVVSVQAACLGRPYVVLESSEITPFKQTESEAEQLA
jgi:hypothetical protein